MKFDLKQLRHFVCVVDTGNITRAAELQYITQPALTRSIKKMEERIGAKLLDRSPRRITPTEAGRVLYRYAKIIINQAERALLDVTAVSQGEQGHVHIGIAALFAPTLISHLIPQLSARFPGLHVRITEGFFEDLVAGLVEGEIDVLLSNFPPGVVPPDVELKPLFDIRTEFVVGASHPLASQENVTAKDLREAQWAIIKQPYIIDFLDKFFAEESLPPVSVAIEATSLNTLKSLVLLGQYVAMLPRRWIEKELETGEIKTIRKDGAALVREAGLILRQTETRRPTVENVIPVIEESCREWQIDR
ncbi:MAG: LysR family transcriptional regulator [Gammaproteobacteria bacterium]|nr:LysR family transcriptional regulator [Gammaproteobacteria bacterium]